MPVHVYAESENGEQFWIFEGEWIGSLLVEVGIAPCKYHHARALLWRVWPPEPRASLIKKARSFLAIKIEAD